MADPVLVIAWLVLAHVAADFVFQTGGVALAKAGRGRRAIRGLVVLTGTDIAIGFVVAAKTLARFRLLDDRDFAEYYLLGTLASVSVAIVTALIGRAALGVLLA
jgi:hypothetical protein